jgi:hypothetical protein
LSRCAIIGFSRRAQLHEVVVIVIIIIIIIIIIIVAQALGVSGRAALCAPAWATYCEREERILLLQCWCALCGFIGASRDACPVCDKRFYGKQKFVRCGACDIRTHCVCLQLGDAEQVTISATVESTYKCDSCAETLGSSDKDKIPAKSPESLCRHGATSCVSSNEGWPVLRISVLTISPRTFESPYRTKCTSNQMLLKGLHFYCRIWFYESNYVYQAEMLT